MRCTRPALSIFCAVAVACGPVVEVQTSRTDGGIEESSGVVASSGATASTSQSGSHSESGSTTGTPAPRTIARLALGYYTTCVIFDTGEARCWGVNWVDALGTDYFGDDEPASAVPDLPLPEPITALSIGNVGAVRRHPSGGTDVLGPQRIRTARVS